MIQVNEKDLHLRKSSFILDFSKCSYSATIETISAIIPEGMMICKTAKENFYPGIATKENIG